MRKKEILMDKHYTDDSLTLHTDLYQINMAETYWADGMHERKAVFELFFRKLPFGNGYATFAGLERVLDYLKNFHFSESDIAYLRNELSYKEDFLDYLNEVRFRSDLYQINMAETYWADGMHERKAVFELFFRKLPFGNGYATFAGLERVLDYLKNFHFSESDIAYLRNELGYKEDFLDYLKEVRF